MTRVGMVVYGDYSTDARVQSYANALAEAGVQVDVIGPVAFGRFAPRPRAGIRVLPVRTRRITGGQSSQVFGWLTMLLMVGAKLTALSLRYRYDVIHVHNMPNMLVFAALVPRLLGSKIILDIHDLMPEVFMSGKGCDGNHPAVRMLRLEEKISASFAHTIITACDTFRGRLAQRGIDPSRVTVIYNVPDPSIFAPKQRLKDAEQRDGLTLIYTGTIVPRYGLSVATRALPILAERIAPVRLLLIGRQSPHVAQLLREAEELGVSSLIEYRPGIPLSEVAVALDEADIGIYTALPDAQMSVAVPGKVLEYAVKGLPIVASRLDVLASLFPPSALMLFEPGNAQEFAGCVLELYAHPERRAELAQNMDRSYVQTHTWRNEMGTYFDVLNRLLAGRARIGFGAAGAPGAIEGA